MDIAELEKKMRQELSFAEEHSQMVISKIQKRIENNNSRRFKFNYRFAAVAVLALVIAGSIFSLSLQPNFSHQSESTIKSQVGDPLVYTLPAPTAGVPTYVTGQSNTFDPTKIHAGDKVGEMTVTKVESNTSTNNPIKVHFTGDIDITGSFTYLNSKHILLGLDPTSIAKLPYPWGTTAYIIISPSETDLRKFGEPGQKGLITARINEFTTISGQNPNDFRAKSSDEMNQANINEIRRISLKPIPFRDMNFVKEQYLTPFPSIYASNNDDLIISHLKQSQEAIKGINQLFGDIGPSYLSPLELETTVRQWLSTLFTADMADRMTKRLFASFLDGVILAGQEDFSPPANVIKTENARVTKENDNTFTFTETLLTSGTKDYQFICKMMMGPDGQLKISDYSYKPMISYPGMDQAPKMVTGDFPIPETIKAKWEEAKSRPNETTAIKDGNTWYIYPQTGYLVERVDASTDNKLGMILLSRSTKGTVPCKLENYSYETLSITGIKN